MRQGIYSSPCPEMIQVAYITSQSQLKSSRSSASIAQATSIEETLLKAKAPYALDVGYIASRDTPSHHEQDPANQQP